MSIAQSRKLGMPTDPAPIRAKRQATTELTTSKSSAKKRSKWSPEEDNEIIRLRGAGTIWEDVSKHLPGRSAISCRLRYQNYLEMKSEWDEDRKSKLAMLYERFKADMWMKIAKEMAIPWRAVEEMHWQLGELDMAKRAGVTPFMLTNVNNHNSSQQNPADFSSQTLQPWGNSDPRGCQQLPYLAALTAGLPTYSSTPCQNSSLPHLGQLLTPPSSSLDQNHYFTTTHLVDPNQRVLESYTANPKQANPMQLCKILSV